MANVTVQKRGKYYQYKFEIASVDGKRKFYISSTGKEKKDLSDVFDSFMSSDTINEIIKYEIGY